MSNDNISAFLQDIGAIVPDNFSTEVDEALILIATDISSPELVSKSSAQNVEYSGKFGVITSDSDHGEAAPTGTKFPIHKRKS